VQQCLALRARLQEANTDQEDLVRQIGILNQELKLQERHFLKEIKGYEEQLAHRSDNMIPKDAELMIKLKQYQEGQAKDLKKNYALNQNIRDNEAMAR
jgi:hypothetical protein